MSFVSDTDEMERVAGESASGPNNGRGSDSGFKRHLFGPSLILAIAEAVLVVLPMWSLFELGSVPTATLVRIALPVLVGMTLVWIAALAAYLGPVQRAMQLRKRGQRIPRELAERAYHQTLHMPLRLLALRTGLWTAAAGIIGLFLVHYAGWWRFRVVELTALATMHAFVVSVVRAVWFARILGRVRAQLLTAPPAPTPLERFADTYVRRLVLVAAVIWAGTLGATSAFLFYFLPISLQQYLQFQAYLPTALAAGIGIWLLTARRLTRALDRYLTAQIEHDPEGVNPKAMYRHAQLLPYRLALANLAIWAVIMAGGAWVARSRLRFAFDDTVLMVGIGLLTALGGAIYESLWHRETLRPLLSHLILQHRLSVRALQPTLSLRTKLLMSFGGVVFLACGMALFWGFVQYKSLVDDFVSRQAELSLAWLRSEVKGAAASGAAPPSTELVRAALASMDRRGAQANAVFYYLPRGASGRAIEITPSTDGTHRAPALPWYAVATMALERDGDLDLGASMGMGGRHGRLLVRWQQRVFDLGAVAVLYPDYRGGRDSVGPLKELFVFFLALFGACAGIVTLTVGQFVTPIRKLEKRADGMARGELAEPVSSGGEGDEVGRLTYALEEMRRALRDKIRSTEEVNMDLERAVQRRTADLAKKNRELAEALDKLTRTQDQLVRSEKMASIGQLVAGIAHEINNPVNAIVNTVVPLEEAIDAAISSPDAAERSEAKSDVSDMIRVIQRGAQRTKVIVQALHNYSRTDDEQVVDFDLNRSLDDSLELLRHLLKQNTTVERDYGQVGRIRGHAGQINQVFMNLLTNAAQALSGRDGALIRVVTRAEGPSVIIRVCDNGPGIPPEVLPRIFDPFFTTKDVGEGTGLGLSIVHRLVERHGGTIEVDSELGVGTCFIVTLPRTTGPHGEERP